MRILAMTMNNDACELEQAVDVEVSLSFAWFWRTDVRNWEDPPARFQLEGPFASGSWGTTLLPGQQPLRWRIAEAHPPRSFTIEMPLDRAVLSFEWRFDRVSDRRTRITQRIMLSGENAGAYATDVRDGFGSTLADGMQRMAEAMAAAAHSAASGSQD